MGAIAVRIPPSQDLCCSWARPQERPFREDLTVQSSPNVPGFLSTPSLTAMLLRTATNLSGTAVKKKLKVLNLLSPRLMIRTAWELLPWRIFLSVSHFLLNHSTAVRMITMHRRVYTADYGCALSKLHLHGNALGVTVIPIRGGARGSERLQPTQALRS